MKHERGRCTSVGQRNLRGGGCAQGRSHAWHNLDKQCRLVATLLTSSPARPKIIGSPLFNRITRNPASANATIRKLISSCDDVLLPAALAHVMHLRRGGNKLQDFGRDQVVVQHSVGSFQQAQPFHRQQFRITRPRTHQINLPVHAPSPFAANSGVFGQCRFQRFPAGQRMQQFKLAFFLKIAGKNQFSRLAEFRYPGCVSRDQIVFRVAGEFSAPAMDSYPAVETAICRSPRRTTAG